MEKMKEYLRPLLAALRRLMPSQRNSGDAAVQVGHAGRDVHVVNLTQHITAPPSPPAVLPTAAPAKPDATVPEVLRLLDQLEAFGKRGVVLSWMQASFRSSHVKSLEQGQLNRTRGYASKVLENSLDEARVAQLAGALRNQHR